MILEEILMNLDTPDDRVHTLLAEAMFPGHPLGPRGARHPAVGGGGARDQLAEFFGHWYRPRNLVIVAAGNLSTTSSSTASIARWAGATAGSARRASAPRANPTHGWSWAIPPSRYTPPSAGGASTITTTTATR